MIYKPKARRDAFLVLYQWDMKGEPIENIIEDYLSANRITLQDQRRYMRKLIRTFMEHSLEIDKLIAKYSEKWDIDRVGYIERNILRIALTESLYLSVKNPKVIASDYVKMTEKYAGKNGARFVNGIIGRVLRERLNIED